MTRFWKSWLTIWCVGVGVFGLVLYGAGFEATTAPAAALFSAFGNPLPADPDRYLRFAIALMGAVTFGWSVTYYAAFRAVWALEPIASVAIWRILTLGAAIWYAIDSFASAANGFPANVASNTVVVIAYLIPLVATGLLRRPVAIRAPLPARP